MINLGILEEIEDLRKVWAHEAHDFTPWLVKNICILSETIEQSNDWVKEMKKISGSVEKTVFPKIKDTLQWGVVKAGDIIIAKGSDEEFAYEDLEYSYHLENSILVDWLL